ncbi:hypothetical protein ADIS_1819 [Lunatimonas lonarensis]|uniref:PH domain-containing protein n=1 Tax=Lunatimonas lonarensis TaxID=1232681 RepID=R7ZU07_9BACT|nr:hypothetical protein [Lunatimonas lonarensis]EON77600.1 hypothetical protein ADIS_1819 [Lunatimonas lonarensis]
MIHCRPKTKTYISLILIVLVLIAGLVYLLFDFSRHQTYGLWFYLIACPLLTVVLLLLLVKMMAGFKFISAGNNELVVRIPLKSLRASYPISAILGWQEEVIKANKREFKHLNILLDRNNSFSISNHEHEKYEELAKYLQKKVPKKRIKT